MKKIRMAQLQDADAIIEFQIKMALETEDFVLDKETVRSGVNAIFSDPNKGNYFVCYDDSRIIASLLITPEWSDWRNGFVWWIQSVFVISEYRKQGVFAAMYQFIKTELEKNESVMGLRLYVEKNNLRAQNVYKKMGMNADHYDLYEWMK
ncbi:MAG: GNAT family N-acetyltransferase [Bacteroidales bacterium]|nr:GNAT family N-acetyltransferase [Bacteroidales bacterium]